MSDLDQQTRHHLEAARSSGNGRSAELLLHDGVLRQTVIALTAGTTLAEHNAPHAASVLVLHGSVQVTGMPEPALRAGELVPLTHDRHAVVALEDSAFLLTTVTSLESYQVADGATHAPPA